MTKVGDIVTCAETGKTFVVESTGVSFNYATDREGRVFSDEGVNIRQKRDLLDRSKPFTCYLGKGDVTGWKGNVLGRVVSTSWGTAFRQRLVHVRVVDVHGGRWYGKGSGEGMCITLYPNKEKTHD